VRAQTSSPGNSAAARSCSLSSPHQIPAGLQSLIIPALTARSRDLRHKTDPAGPLLKSNQTGVPYRPNSTGYWYCIVFSSLSMLQSEGNYTTSTGLLVEWWWWEYRRRGATGRTLSVLARVPVRSHGRSNYSHGSEPPKLPNRFPLRRQRLPRSVMMMSRAANDRRRATRRRRSWPVTGVGKLRRRVASVGAPF